MTLVLRRRDTPMWLALACGWCRVGLCEIVGVFGAGKGVMQIVFLPEAA